MLFNSTRFLLFLPTVLILVAVLPRSWRNRVLLVASYVFYGSWDWRFLALIFLTTTIDYSVSRAIFASNDPRQRRRLLLVSVCGNLGILGFFKYYNFFVDSAVTALQAVGVHASMPPLAIILPVGISFYTFQSMSYSIDVYRRQLEPVTRFWDYALYVAYFPQLVAGPIERAGNLLPQILSPGRVSPARIDIGLTLIVIGFLKKVLIADMIAPEVDRIFSDPTQMSSGLLLKGAYLFAFQIYGDFSGYSDIARGVSELFGIRLMVNFNQPYLSASITEFWRRWHISLSTWLRDYLYVTLGGNRVGSGKTYRNLMLTMLIGALWHGANWTFVVWGGLHGLLLAVERALGIGKRTRAGADTLGWRRLLGILVTFHVATFIWIFFRSPNFTVAFQYMSGLLQCSDLAAVGALPFLVAAVLLAIDIPQNASGEHTVFLRTPWWIRSPVYCGLCMAILGRLLYGGQELPFIYFQF
jgi:D-alanyl-lipoteichoic acid acyltransferase DltB (MBOAT superfamily)